MKLDLIIRTSKRKKEAKSPKQQRDIAQAYANANGHEIVMTHDSGRSESGKTMDRASVHAAMERVHAGLSDGVIVSAADRIGRAPIEEAMTFVRELSRVGTLAIADMGLAIDTEKLHDPMTESFVVQQLQMARQYWLQKAAGMKRSQRDAIAAGKHVGPTPFGYVRKASRLHVSSTRGPIVHEAYRLAGHYGIHAAVDYLRKQVPQRRWDTDHVRRLLRNRVYLGESRTGTLVHLTAHEPIVSLAEWTAAQTTPQGRRKNGEYPLSGVARCGRCEWTLVGALQSVGERTYRRYRCSNPGCRGGSSISADKLEGHVHDQLADAIRGGRLGLSFDDAVKLEAERALAAAEWNLGQFLEGTSGLPAAQIAAGVARLQAAINGAQGDFQAAVKASARDAVLPTVDELDDPEQLLRAVEAGVRLISVRPGRGDGRIRLVFVGQDLDDSTGMLAA